MTSMTYNDGRLAVDDTSVTIRWYYPWGSKVIAFDSIESVSEMSLRGWWGRWRIFGSGDFVHWFNLDASRPHKISAVELRVGKRIRPTVTPDDVPAFLDALAPKVARDSG
jgi:hypothetical protein